MNSKLIDQAVSIFNSGGIVIFPTDTAFGIGCRIDKLNAIDRLLKIKQKPANSPLPALVASHLMAEKYFMTPLLAQASLPAQAGLPEKIKDLMNNFWPGGLTVVYYANTAQIPESVRGKDNTVGLRMPDNRDLLIIIEKVGVPIVGTSANLSGQKTPYTYTDLDQKITRLVDLVLPGTCEIKQASTVVDCTQKPWKILRQGSVILNL